MYKRVIIFTKRAENGGIFMTRFLKNLEARMNDPKLNQKFSQAVQLNQKVVNDNTAAYNRAKKNFYLAQDK